jgi:hypothetical protein
VLMLTQSPQEGKGQVRSRGRSLPEACVPGRLGEQVSDVGEALCPIVALQQRLGL